VNGPKPSIFNERSGDEERELGAESSSEDVSDIESELFNEDREEKRRFLLEVIDEPDRLRCLLDFGERQSVSSDDDSSVPVVVLAQSKLSDLDSAKGE